MHGKVCALLDVDASCSRAKFAAKSTRAVPLPHVVRRALQRCPCIDVKDSTPEYGWRLLHCGIATRVTSAWGQNEKPPSLGLCQLPPAADTNRAATHCHRRRAHRLGRAG